MSMRTSSVGFSLGAIAAAVTATAGVYLTVPSSSFRAQSVMNGPIIDFSINAPSVVQMDTPFTATLTLKNNTQVDLQRLMIEFADFPGTAVPVTVPSGCTYTGLTGVGIPGIPGSPPNIVECGNMTIRVGETLSLAFAFSGGVASANCASISSQFAGSVYQWLTSELPARVIVRSPVALTCPPPSSASSSVVSAACPAGSVPLGASASGCPVRDPLANSCPGGGIPTVPTGSATVSPGCTYTCYACSTGGSASSTGGNASSTGGNASSCPTLAQVQANSTIYYASYGRDTGPITSQTQLNQGKTTALCDPGDKAVSGFGTIATCANCGQQMLEYNGRVVVNGAEGWASYLSYEGDQIYDTVQTIVKCMKRTAVGMSTIDAYEVVNTTPDFYLLDQDRSQAFCNAGDIAIGGGGNPAFCDNPYTDPACGKKQTLTSDKRIVVNGIEGWETVYDLDGNGKSDTQRTSVTCLKSVCSNPVGFCANPCGDGTVIQGEECDHGAKNGTPGDSCSVSCKKISSSSSAMNNSASSQGSSASALVCIAPSSSGSAAGGTALRGAHTGDYDGFGIGLAPNVSYTDFNQFAKSCDEPPSMDHLTYGTGWGNRPLTGDYVNAQRAQPFKVYLPPMPPNATIASATAIFVTADLDDGQPNVKDRLYINNIEIIDAFKNAGQAQYLPGKAGKTAQITVSITDPSVLTSLRSGNISMMVDDVTTGTSEPEGFAIDYVKFDMKYKCDNPGPNQESCNGMDDDCDGIVDEGLTTKPYYVDMDGNGKNGTLAGHFCTSPGYGSLAADEACVQATANKQCADGLDNDSDNKVDALDPGCHTDGNAANAASYDPQDDDERDASCVKEVMSGGIANVPNPDPDNGVSTTFSENLDCGGWNAFLSTLSYKDGASDSLSVLSIKCKPLNLDATLGTEFPVPPSAQYTAGTGSPVTSTCPAGTIPVGIYQKDIPQSDLQDGSILACAPVTTNGVGSALPPSAVPSDLSTNTQSFTPVLCPAGYALTGVIYKGLGSSDSINTLHCQAITSFCKP